MALEVRVNATGARPSQGHEKRELFSEETQTTLVFPDAAVISLNAAVVPGQLIFLTNKENGREVVCQVIQKRNYRPTTCYVELQFTEPQADFWGVKFPEKPASLAQTELRPAEVSESVVSAEVTEEAAAPAAEPNAKEVALLRDEVNALREQLRALTEEKKREEEAAKRTAEDATKKTEAEASAGTPLVRMNLPAVTAQTAMATAPWERARAAVSTPPLSNASATVIAPATGRTGDTPRTEGKEGHSEERAAFEDLLPHPELDFSRLVLPGKGAKKGELPHKKGKKNGARMIAAAAMLLAAGLGVAWYKDWLPMMRRGSSALSKSAKSGTPAKVGKAVGTPAGPTSQVVSASGEGEKNRSLAAGANDAAFNRDDKYGADGADNHTNARDDETNRQRSDLGKAPQTEAKKDSPGAAHARNDGLHVSEGKRTGVGAGALKKDRAAAVPVAAEAEPAADAPLVAAKLVRAASPVYPPDAMRHFITGDVRISAEVGADGRIGKVTVISGPAALRDAAVKAMKKYEYEPATKGGKAVASQVTVTIKFWFNP
jgi:protein TonB